MRSLKTLATGWVCSVAMTAAAHAADMPEVPFIEKPVYADLVSGWYARVDAAYRWQTFGSIEGSAPNVMTAWAIDNTPAVGFGGGYKYQWFRADVTFDYGLPARFEADTAAVSPFYSAKLSSFTILANVYLDLGEWGGFTPYVGAGIGGTNLRINDVVMPGMIGLQVWPVSRWNVSWAAMAGLAYRVSPKLVIDVGYRYLSMGDIVGGREPPLYTERTTFADLTAQELRVGFRWMFD